MTATFRGEALFSSGPSRWAFSAQGVDAAPLAYTVGSAALPGTQARGDLETEIVVTGRLIASTEAGLWTLRRAIVAASAFSLGTGALVDDRGRAWAGFRLMEYAESDRVDRGRVWSVGYTVRFRKIYGDGP